MSAPSGIDPKDDDPLLGSPKGDNATPHSFVFSPATARRDLSDWDYVGRWGSTSKVSVVSDDQLAPGLTWQFVSAGKSGRVGKAYVTKNFPPVKRSEIVEAQGTYLIPELPENGSVYLMDLECRNCGLNTKAGIRLLVRNGLLRVNRSKIGQKKDFLPKTMQRIPVGEPFTLRMRLRLGATDGETEVFFNGERVIHGVGINMPLRRVAERYGVELTQEQYDYVQFGITANSARRPVEVLISEIRVTTSK